MFDSVGMVEQARKVAGHDVTLASDDELLEAVLDVQRASRALASASSSMLTELDVRGTTDREFGQTTATWFAHQLREPTAASRATVRLGRRLRAELDLVDDALADGRIGVAHAEVFSRASNPRIADEIARLQPELLELAEAASFERFRAEVMGLSERLDQDGPFDPDRLRLERNRLTLTKHGRTWRLRGELDPETGASLKEMLDREADRLFRRFAADEEVTAGELEIPPRATISALALVELCRKGTAADVRRTDGPVTDLTVVLDDDDPEVLRTLDGVPLLRRHLDCRLCDAAIRFLEHDGDGAALRLGHTQRFANRAQRRANAIRDGGCVFPGCDAPVSWTEQHHVVDPDHGGPTDTDNLASLCRFHHRVSHRVGWAMYATDDEWFWWRAPSGRTIWSQRHGRQRAGPIPDG